MGGRVELMFSYRKARRIVSNATQVFTEAFPQSPPSLTNVQAAAATGKWSGHGWYKGAWNFVRRSEMWCVGTLSSEDDGRQTFRHLRRSFRQSVQDNPLGFCHADTTPEGAQGKLCVSQGRITTFQSCQAGSVLYQCWTDCRSKPVALYFHWNRVRLMVLLMIKPKEHIAFFVSKRPCTSQLPRALNRSKPAQFSRKLE